MVRTRMLPVEHLGIPGLVGSPGSQFDCPDKSVAADEIS